MKIKMNIKYIGLTIILFLVSIGLFFQKVNAKELRITNLDIINYIPNDNEISLISNANTFEINQFINSNIEKDFKEDFITLKKGIYSFLGFDLQEKFKDIYDGEFALSIFNKNNIKEELLLIIKVKESKNINNILNINENLNKANKIISFNRPEKINFLKYVIQTKENYIIFASSKDLINSSINKAKDDSNKNRIHKLPQKILKVIKNDKLLFLSNENLINHTLGENYFSKDEYFITLLKYKNHHLNFRSYSLNNNENLTQDKLDNDFVKINGLSNIVLANYFNVINGEFPFLKINYIQNKIIEEIRDQINNKILILSNENFWTLVLQNNKKEDIFFDKLNILNDFNKSNIKINNINYSVFSKDRFNYKNNKVSYEKENPIFIKEYSNLIFISNDFLSLSENEMIETFSQEYFNNNLNSDSNNNLFIDDKIYLNNYSQNIMNNTYPIFNKINLFISNTLNLKVNQFTAKIEQGIPELNPTIFIESELQIL